VLLMNGARALELWLAPWQRRGNRAT
jgi:hypothetical protein